MELDRREKDREREMDDKEDRRLERQYGGREKRDKRRKTKRSRSDGEDSLKAVLKTQVERLVEKVKEIEKGKNRIRRQTRSSITIRWR